MNRTLGGSTRWLCAALALHAGIALAQPGTIGIVVGYPAGATSDALTRVVAEQMAKALN